MTTSVLSMIDWKVVLRSQEHLEQDSWNRLLSHTLSWNPFCELCLVPKLYELLLEKLQTLHYWNQSLIMNGIFEVLLIYIMNVPNSNNFLMLYQSDHIPMLMLILRKEVSSRCKIAACYRSIFFRIGLLICCGLRFTRSDFYVTELVKALHTPTFIRLSW